jgi:hypothetical protein
VKPYKISIKFGKGAKLSPRFVGPFEVVERKGPLTYRLPFLDSLRRMQDVFHVFVLRHYVSDAGASSTKATWDESTMLCGPFE